MDAPIRLGVIGAGAAGLMAATEAALRGASVILLEKNRKTGVKILMSGGTRCNLTHHAEAKEIAEAFGHARRFLQPCLGAFPPADVVRLFHEMGVPTKVEVTGKVFPASDRALHVRDALLQRAIASGVTIVTDASVKSLVADEAQGWRIQTKDAELVVDRVIVTAGGKSWPGCGTTGDAYAWLRQLGHTIVPPRPALVPLTGGLDWMHELSGITLPDCVTTVWPSQGASRKPLARRRSSLLFTHFGFSGPAAMDISGALTEAASFDDRLALIDLIPAIEEAQLRSRLVDRSGDGGRKRVASLLTEWLPGRLAIALAAQAGANSTVAELSRRACQDLVDRLKRLPMIVTGTLGFDKAEVTAGGVSLDEVDPRTMASRIAKGLYIAGEVLDVDGPIGGYNFQAAFSTGRAAAIAAAQRD